MAPTGPPESPMSKAPNDEPPAPAEEERNPEDGDDEGNAGAFDPATGEINWDCPCLGGMAHGPCGQQFRDAFSCFVYSSEEPKGMDCIELFKNMQDCFRAHPDVYGEEIADDEDSASGSSPEGHTKPPTSTDAQDTSSNIPSPAGQTNEAAS